MRGGPRLVIPAPLHAALLQHVMAPDGLEAAAILLCSRIKGRRLKLLGRELIVVPHNACQRRRDHLIWPGEYVEQALDRAEDDDLSLILVHSHPGGYFKFSELDDVSDRQVMPSLFAARPKDRLGHIVHGSAIVMPCGAVRGRLYEDARATPADIELVSIPGNDLKLCWAPANDEQVTVEPRPMAFTTGMGLELSNISACVVGVSGTGSLVAEQLARLGIGELILIDFDRVERKNLNRIINSTMADVETERHKVEMFAAAVATYSPSTHIRSVPHSIVSATSVRAAAEADVLFSCVDSDEGRLICDLMAQAFVQPLFDVGVTIPVRKDIKRGSAIADVVGRIDYVQPGGSSLEDRGVFTPESLRREHLARNAPDILAQQQADGYLKGFAEEAPSVISLNMRAASACAMEFIARTYPFRIDPNRLRAQTIFSLAACEEDYKSEDDLPRSAHPHLAYALKEPLLGLMLPETEVVQ